MTSLPLCLPNICVSSDLCMGLQTKMVKGVPIHYCTPLGGAQLAGMGTDAQVNAYFQVQELGFAGFSYPSV